MSGSYYSRLQTSKIYRTNSANLYLHPVVTAITGWWSGTNAIFTGVRLDNINQIRISNTTFSNTSTPLSVNSTSVLYRVPDLAAANLYTLELFSDISVYRTQIYGSVAANQITYTANGIISFTVPPGVYDISVLCVGSGGKGAGYNNGPTNIPEIVPRGGGGGALVYYNNYPVKPGEVYTIALANNASRSGGNSTFSNSTSIIISAFGGQHGAFANQAYIGSGSDLTSGTQAAGGAYFGIAGAVGYRGGHGGRTASTVTSLGSGGGGAAGYSGNGGDGGGLYGYAATPVPKAGSGGGGGGGSTYYDMTNSFPLDSAGVRNGAGGGGGGVGIFGQGTSGTAGGTANVSTGSPPTPAAAGGGSGGQNGTVGLFSIAGQEVDGGPGGWFGGGGGAGTELLFAGNNNIQAAGGNNVLRIIWGPNRSYPNTNTNDL